MKKTYLLSTLLCLLTVALPAQAVTLRYSLKKGAELTYRVQAASASRMSGMTEEKLGFQSQIDQTYRLKVLEVSASGDMEIEQELLAGTAKMRMGGEEHKTPLRKGKARFKISPRGKIILPPPQKEAEPAVEEGEPNLTSLSALGTSGPGREMDFLSAGIVVPFPEKAVNPGETWEEELEMNSSWMSMFGEEASDAPASRVKVKSELVELVLYKGKKCAHIRTTYELPFSRESPSEESYKLSVSGKVAGEVEWYFDYENSSTPTAKGNLQTLMKMTVELPPEMAEEAPPEFTGGTTSAMKVNMKTTLVEKEK